MSSDTSHNSSNVQEQQQTLSALSNELESFLRSFKDRGGTYKYFDKINNIHVTNNFDKTFRRKIQEIVLATTVSSIVPKNAIPKIYLNPFILDLL